MFYSETDSGIDTGREDWPRRGLGERMRDALDVAIAVLLLEDDHDVDWHLPDDFESELRARDERRAPRRRTGLGRARTRARRPGAIAAKPQPCLSPIASRSAAPRHQARSR
jgi:hypothetical protein